MTMLSRGSALLAVLAALASAPRVAAAAAGPDVSPPEVHPFEGEAGAEAEGATAAPCSADQWRCGDGARCIPAAWRCDGRPHCADASDELLCEARGSCTEGQFRCVSSGRCVPAAWRCDGDPDCGRHDHSDEDAFLCAREHKCLGNTARCATPAGGSFPCVPVAAFCDGHRDCVDGSDEWDICDNFTSTKCTELECTEGCKPTHDGPACFCQPGFEPRNGLCVDTDECEQEEVCPQLCHNTVGNFSCACATGYRMEPNGDCTAINDPESEPLALVVVTERDVRFIEGRGAGPAGEGAGRERRVPALNVRAIDFHYTNRSICYVHHNLSRASIVCLHTPSLTNRTVLAAPDLFPDISSVSHLAIDWIADNWYLADEAREVVYVCERSLQHCRLLLERGLRKLRALALDPTRGEMFWCVWGAEAPSIGRASLAGEPRAPLGLLALVYPSALALDLARARVVWADAYLARVQAAQYGGGRRHTLRPRSRADRLLQLDTFQRRLYLPVWENSSLLLGDRSVQLDARPAALRVFHRQRQPLVDHPCARDKGGCAHICVTSYRAGAAHAHCLCRHGYRLAGAGDCVRAELPRYLVVARGSPPMVQSVALEPRRAGWEPAAPATRLARVTALAVDVAAGWLYYCDVHRFEIVRQKLDGSAREVFVSADVDNCEGLALDSDAGNLYWSDDALGTISVARLEAPHVRRTLLAAPGSHPRALALAPGPGPGPGAPAALYWASWAARAALYTSDLAGGNVTALLDTDLHWPNGLALHGDYLYWCDTYLNKIERLQLRTRRRQLLLRSSPDAPLLKPYGLAVYDDAVVWSEHGTGRIRRLAGGAVSELAALPPPLYELRLVDASPPPPASPCAVNNGGCAELCVSADTATGRLCLCGDGRQPAARAARAARAAAADGHEPAAQCVNATAAPPYDPCAPDDKFHCGRGRCIEAQYVCDGDADCDDARDEDTSPRGPCANVTCKEDQFKCDANRCISKRFVCDGFKDCTDGADEAACGACAAAQWACALSRRCVPAAWRCDGAADCGPGDDSDERHCPAPGACPVGSFSCGAVGAGGAGGAAGADARDADARGGCVPWEYFCDGHADCADASDERSCPPNPDRQEDGTDRSLCEHHEFQCDNGECIRLEFRCDARVDCLDGSDESACNGTVTSTSTAGPGPAPGPGACAAPALSCEGGRRCVPLAQQCDGAADCADGADEADRCGEPQCSPGPCSHGCRPAPAGPVCLCPPDMQLLEDGVTCAAAAPCARWGVCAQRCEAHKRAHKCTCYDGYRLAADGFSCKSTDPTRPLLIFSSRHEIRGVELAGGGAAGGAGGETSRALLSGLKNAVALDWRIDPDTNQTEVYWTDVVEDGIFRARLVGAGGAGGAGEADAGGADGPALAGVTRVLRGGLAAAEGLAVDWRAHNLYWADSAAQQIEVSRLDGRWRRTLVAGGMAAPRALAADPAAALLFWSDWENAAPRIERASLAGTERRLVVRVDRVAGGAAGAWPNGVALDARARRVYWADARADSLHCASYEGGDARRVLDSAAALAHPFALAVFERRLYWTDWRSNSVLSADKFTGAGVRRVQRSLSQPFDIKVIHPSRQRWSGPEPCAGGGGCSHLCLLSAPGQRLCACPHVMRLSADDRTCEPHEQVLFIGRAGSLRGVEPANAARLTVPSVAGAALAQPASLAFHARTRTLYWADPVRAELRATGLTEGPPRVVVDSGLRGLRAVALDWARQLLYCAGAARLRVSELGGEASAILFRDLHDVTAVAVHPLRGALYWAHSPPDGAVLETSYGNGAARRVLLTRRAAPQLADVTGMTVDVNSSRLYWVNLASATIQYMDLDTERVTTVALGAGARPTALEVYGGQLYWADAAAAALRRCAAPRCHDGTVLLNDTEGVVSLRVYDAALQAGGGGRARACAAAACAQLCLPAPPPADTACACAQGFTARGNDCIPVDEVLIYSLSWELRGIALGADGLPAGAGAGAGADREDGDDELLPPLAELGMAAALDYDAEEGWIYWADPEAGGVLRVRRDGSGRGPAVRGAEGAGAGAEGAAPGALALDAAARVLYWSEPQRRVLLAARLGGAALVLLDTDPVPVTSLALDAAAGWLFLAGGTLLQRCRLDGSRRQLLHNGSLQHVAVDAAAQMVYWSDGRSQSLWRAPYAGGAPELLLRRVGLRPAALRVHGGRLYWLDTMLQGGALLAAPLADVADYRVLRRGLGDNLKDLVIWSRAGQAAAAAGAGGACAGGGGCAGLCLRGEGAHAQCRCPHGQLAPDGKNCTPHEEFLMFSTVTRIESAHLDDDAQLNAPAPPIEDKELMRNVIGLAYDYNASRLFYSDIQRGAILSVRFDGSHQELLIPQTGAVEGMVFAAREAVLYWTCASAARIMRVRVPAVDAAPAAARAALPQVLLALPPAARPRGIAHEPCESWLYWSDWQASAPAIRRARTGEPRVRAQTVIGTHILMPNGVALDVRARALYWADARLDKIERAHYDGSHRRIVTAAHAAHPFALAAWRGAVYWSDWVARRVWRAGAGGGARALWTGAARPMALAAVEAPPTCAAADPCAADHAGCAHSCRLSADGHAVCECPPGMQLASDGRACAPAGAACGAGQWACEEGGCVPAALVCDGVPHCAAGPDASDEALYYCTSRVCPADAVPCGAGGRCVPAEAACDGRRDCDDGADERGCACAPATLPCAGACVPLAARCDGVRDCDDGADERFCPDASCATLGARAQPCGGGGGGGGGGCFLPEWRCDNHTDCADGADETDCPAESPEARDSSSAEIWDVEGEFAACGPEQFQCGGGSAAGEAAGAAECVPAAWRCDGVRDCSDGSDEHERCSESTEVSCAAEEFRCGARGPCVPAGARCDGHAHCPRAQDERHCACAPGTLRCAHDGLCLDASLYCDGDADCADGSDEPAGCAGAGAGAGAGGPPLPPLPGGAPPANCAGGARCSGRCVPRELLCDGRDHCQDGGAGTDEDPEVCAMSYARAAPGGADAADARAGAGAGAARCAGGEWRCRNSACVPRAALCDARDDCGDFSDEELCGGAGARCGRGACAAGCSELRVGRACWCRAGYRLRADARACADVDECREDDPCDHHCRNTIGSFVCSCAEGYKLMEDGISCIPISEVPASLIFTNRYYIRRAELAPPPAGLAPPPAGLAPPPAGPRTALLVHNLTNAVALDFHWETGCLYWSDVTRPGSSIKRLCRPEPAPPGRLPPHRPQDFELLHSATLQNPDGLAVEWVAGNLYWCDKGADTIEVSRLDGAHRRVLLRHGLQEPRALALLPAKGWLYWSDWGAEAHIGRAGLDGSSPRRLVTRGLGWPNALTLVPAADELYFADAREDYIAVADLDGNNVRVLFSRERQSWLRLHHVFALAAWGGRLYWSDWETRAVESCRRRALPPALLRAAAANASDDAAAWRCDTLLHAVHKPMDLRLFHPSRQPPEPELTAQCAALNCSGLCLLSPTEGGARAACACPEHFELQADGRGCAARCSPAHFVCRSALKCIPFWWRCDTQDDCGDGSDEEGDCAAFGCAPGQLQCGARCLHPAHICDGTPHCARAEDEAHCADFTCLAGQWKCAGNASGAGARCIPLSQRCDGTRDCAAGEDEADCPPRTCQPHEFLCGSGACVSLVWTCDGDRDCADGADEGAWCATRACPAGHLRCAGGRCVPRAWLCDGQPDCPAREDERACDGAARAPCDPTYFRCDTGDCVPGRWRCDYEDDCGDGSDERDCAPRNCSESEFRCGSGECVRAALRCDGVRHCAGGEDEADCAPACAPDARACAHARQCVRREWWCDGEADCADGSDEAECAGAGAGAGAMRACAGGGFRCGGGCLPPAWRCDARADCAGAQDESAALCADVACAPGMLRCPEHTCVPRGALCDGVRDCAGGDDEAPRLCHDVASASAQEPGVCAPGERLCAGTRCLPDDVTCDEGEGARSCAWAACSQLCLPRAGHAPTCKCAAGWRARGGGAECAAGGPAAVLLLARGADVLLADLHHKSERELSLLHRHPPEHGVRITCATGGELNGTWWAWWGDEEGERIYRADATAGVRGGEAGVGGGAAVAVEDAGAVRGLALLASAGGAGGARLLWTARRGARGGLYSAAAADGARRVALYERADCYPDDVAVLAATGEVFWTERGRGGVMRASLSGLGARPLVSVRVRRGGALALDAPARRLYALDTYYGALETVLRGGEGRALLAQLTRAGAASPPPYNSSARAAAAPALCARAAVWEDWLLCAGRRGLLRLHKRAPPAPAPAPAPASDLQRAPPLDAIAVLHPLQHQIDESPCAGAGAGAGGRAACDASAVCTPCAERAAGFACLCAAGFAPDGDEPDSTRRCVPVASESETKSAPDASGACPGSCGAGTCGPAGACECPPLFEGARCEHYRCAKHCSANAACALDQVAAPARDGRRPLKCVCHPGFTGELCETAIATSDVPPAAAVTTLTSAAAAAVTADGVTASAVTASGVTADEGAACARVRCENGGRCRQQRNYVHCECPPGYDGSRCEQCSDAAACARGAVCRRAGAGGAPRCEPAADPCRGHCLHQGACHVTDGRAQCACAEGWRGARCELPPAAPCTPAGNCTDSAGEGEGEGDGAPCGPLRCEHGGRCEPTAAGGACRCAGGWGGAQCAHYTGRDHACDARRCAAPAFCAWRPHLAVGDPDATYCACPRGAACAAEAGAGGGGAAGGAWGALAALLLLAALAALLYKLWTRRRRAWAHSRLADDVHISNPMYLAGADDEPEPRNGNHFANPVYDSMYAGDAPRDLRERDNLLHRAAPL